MSWLRSHSNKYFSKSQTICDMNTKQIEMIIERLLMPINAKLDALPTKKDIESSMQTFQEKVARVEERIERVHGEVNDLVQYIRRLDLRIFGVSTSCFHERTVEQWVIQYFTNELAVSLPDDAIERAHRIGKVNEGKVQVIVRFNSWKNRCKVYLNRKKGKLSISADLTRDNQNFLKAVRAVGEKNPDKIAFCFVDINCRIGVKMHNGSLKFPSTIKELVNTLS